MGKIIPIRPEPAEPEVSCFVCEHGYFGRDGVLCEITKTIVHNERTATNCEMFERQTYEPGA